MAEKMAGKRIKGGKKSREGEAVKRAKRNFKKIRMENGRVWQQLSARKYIAH